ncbi:MAG TPA: efflux RND transporter periplasmic adaptor subunit [Casimicrobiaceae bacterium]|nr:efflux RND transporter periplasmic adaptor subunit [Casimicrobiaceae bacterium]
MTTDDLSKLRIDRSLAPVQTRRRRKWLWLGAIAAVVACGGAWVLLQPRALAVQTTPIVTTYPSQQFVVLNSTGYVVAQRKAAISSKASGRLEWLGVAEGTRVKAGEIIARLDSRDVSAQLDAGRANVKVAQAALEQALAEERDAEASLKRTRDLIAQKFVSQSALDQAKARADRAVAGVASGKAGLAVAEANARNAQVAVDYTLIRAPFDGIILSKNANVGDMVTPFSSAADSKGAVVSMADMRTLEVEADVSESSLSKISVGQPTEITLDALPDIRFAGTVSRIVPTVDRAKATVMTKVRFELIDSRVLPEMSAKVSFLSQPVTREQQKPLVAVNPDALAQRDGRTVVFAVRDNRAVEVAVTPGKKIADVTAVAGDVKSGEKAVLKPPAELKDGALVKPAAK